MTSAAPHRERPVVIEEGATGSYTLSQRVVESIAASSVWWLPVTRTQAAAKTICKAPSPEAAT
jgi:hypothetical protein